MKTYQKTKKISLKLERIYKLEQIFCDDKYIRKMKIKKLILE